MASFLDEMVNFRVPLPLPSAMTVLPRDPVGVRLIASTTAARAKAARKWHNWIATFRFVNDFRSLLLKQGLSIPRIGTLSRLLRSFSVALRPAHYSVIQDVAGGRAHPPTPHLRRSKWSGKAPEASCPFRRPGFTATREPASRDRRTKSPLLLH